MGRNWGSTKGVMGNNKLTNKDFERAAREAGLNDQEKIYFSKLLHSEKEFEAGDRPYDDLLELAKSCKK